MNTAHLRWWTAKAKNHYTPNRRLKNAKNENRGKDSYFCIMISVLYMTVLKFFKKNHEAVSDD